MELSYADSKAQLLAVEIKLAKDPENEELLSLKEDLLELLELAKGLEEEKEEQEEVVKAKNTVTGGTSKDIVIKGETKSSRASSSKPNDARGDESDNLVDKNNRRALTEAEILMKKKEKNRKKKAKLHEKKKCQNDIAESEQHSWQSFTNKKGLKGVTKKSIFASPCSVTGKVGVGTNGIADAPSAATSVAGATKRKH